MFTTSLTRARPDEAAVSAGLAHLGLRLPNAAETEVAGTRSVLVRAEQVALRIVDLPMASHRQRAAAVAFAVEDDLAEPLEQVHVALGREVTRGQHLTATARHTRMTAWTRALAETGLPRHRLVPDALSLPRPTEGRWSVTPTTERVIVRTPDGGGFAGGPGFVAAAWAHSDRPKLIAATADAIGANVAGQPLVQPDPGDLDAERDAVAQSFDLCTGPYARRRSDLRKMAPRAAALVAVALTAQVGLTALDAGFVADLRAARMEDARAELRAVAPALATTSDPAAALTSLLGSGTAPRSGRFLHVLAAMSEALDPDGDGIALTAITYSAEANALTIAVSGGDLGALQRVERRFVSAGLSPESGPATQRDGSAEVTLTLTDPAVQ